MTRAGWALIGLLPWLGPSIAAAQERPYYHGEWGMHAWRYQQGRVRSEEARPYLKGKEGHEGTESTDWSGHRRPMILMPMVGFAHMALGRGDGRSGDAGRRAGARAHDAVESCPRLSDEPLAPQQPVDVLALDGLTLTVSPRLAERVCPRTGDSCH